MIIPQKKLGEKKVCLSLQFHSTAQSISEGSQGMNSQADLEEHCLQACSACFLISSRGTAYSSHQVRKCAIGLPPVQSHGGIFNCGCLFSDSYSMCQIDENLSSPEDLQLPVTPGDPMSYSLRVTLCVCVRAHTSGVGLRRLGALFFLPLEIGSHYISLTDHRTQVGLEPTDLPDC